MVNVKWFSILVLVFLLLILLIFIIPKGTVQKTCQLKGGNNCESYEVCNGNILSVSDTNRCCLGQCKLPKSFDWRNRHGENWNSPVKNQGSLGSCLYFSTLGVAESVINLYYNQHIDLDLSEQQLFDCRNDLEYVNFKTKCADCFMSDGICSIINIGVIGEECNPYTASSGNSCNKNPCSNSESSRWKFEDYYNLAFDYNPSGCIHLEKAEEITEEKIKRALIKYGPLDSGMTGHGLALVGYDTKLDGTYWIFKNSWGSETGEGGYFRYKVPVEEAGGISSTQALIKPIPPSGKNYSIKCIDKDNDGFCNWGISEKNHPLVQLFANLKRTGMILIQKLER